MLSKHFLRKIFKINPFTKKVARSLANAPEIDSTDFTQSAKDIEYVEELSKHRTILNIYRLSPYYKHAYISPSATITGEIFIDAYSSIWNNVVIRGDINSVHIGMYSSIGDNTVIQTVASLPSGLQAYVDIQSNVTINNDCTISSCTIEHDVVVGAKSVIWEGAKLEKGWMVAPGSVVPPGRLIPSNQLWAGNPVEYVKDLDMSEIFTNYSLSYVHSELSTMIKDSYTTFPSNYLLKESTKEDVDGKEIHRQPIELDDDSLFFSSYKP
jgi:gamma-carbonic anhydrase